MVELANLILRAAVTTNVGLLGSPILRNASVNPRTSALWADLIFLSSNSMITDTLELVHTVVR